MLGTKRRKLREIKTFFFQMHEVLDSKKFYTFFFYHIPDKTRTRFRLTLDFLYNSAPREKFNISFLAIELQSWQKWKTLWHLLEVLAAEKPTEFFPLTFQKRPPSHVNFRGFCKILQNNCFTAHLRAADSVSRNFRNVHSSLFSQYL